LARLDAIDRPARLSIAWGHPYDHRVPPRLTRIHLLPPTLLCALAAFAVIVACDEADAPAPPPTMTSSEVCADVASQPGAPAVTSAAPTPAAPEPTASTGAAPRAELPVVEFVRASGESVCLPVELVPRSEFSIGLSGRYELDDRGMLFYFGAVHRGGFWMRNTHVDLAIAFVNLESRIVDIREMTAESLETIVPSTDYLYAIEAQPGWYQRNNVAIGDEVRFLFQLPPELSGIE
jgi:uncharacterized membrane protein (UPF0127 family)